MIVSKDKVVLMHYTLKNDKGEILSIKSSDDDVQKLLYNLFYDVLNIEFNLYPWTRNLCKYGTLIRKSGYVWTKVVRS